MRYYHPPPSSVLGHCPLIRHGNVSHGLAYRPPILSDRGPSSVDASGAIVRMSIDVVYGRASGSVVASRVLFLYVRFSRVVVGESRRIP